MTVTTIKVDSALRDQLKGQASALELTLGQHLQRLADAADRDARFARLNREIDSTPPAVMAAYRDETSEWDAASLADLPRG